MDRKAFSKLICFTKLLQNKNIKIQRFSHKMIAKRATVREKSYLPRKKCKVVKWRCWRQAIYHQQYWVCLLCKIQAWQRVYWDKSVGRIITVTSCSRDKLSRCLFWTKISVQPPLEECIQCGEYYLSAESTLLYSCLKYYISTQNNYRLSIHF